MGSREQGTGRLRVAFVAFDSVELSIRLATALSAHAEVLLTLPRTQSVPYMRWLGESVIFRPFDRPRLRQPLRQMALLARLWWTIRRFRPDVIHMQKWHLWFFLALPLFRAYPLVISVHDPEAHLGDRGAEKTPRWVVARGYRKADRLITHNEAMRTATIASHRVDADRVDVIPLVERGDGSLRPDVSERAFEILFFGRIWEYKGLDRLIRAAPLVVSEVPEARFVVAGRGDDLEPYLQMIDDPSRFEIINEFVSEDRQAELFRRAAIVVLPYVEATQSGVIPVAASFGKPVVASRVGGLPEQVEHGVTGLLVPPRDDVALARAIIDLLSDESRRHAMGREARRKARDEWSAAAVARRTLAVYERTIAERRPSLEPEAGGD